MGGNTKVARPVKSKICPATKPQQLRQRLSAMPTRRGHALAQAPSEEGPVVGLEPPAPQSGAGRPMRPATPGPRQQSTGDKASGCGSSGRSSRAAENAAAWAWHYRVAENCVKNNASVVFARPSLQSVSALLPALGSGEGPCSYTYQQCAVPFLPEKIMLISNYCMQCQSINISSFFRSHCAGFKGGSGHLLLQ